MVQVQKTKSPSRPPRLGDWVASCHAGVRIGRGNSSLPEGQIYITSTSYYRALSGPFRLEAFKTMTSQNCPSNLSPRVPTEWHSPNFTSAIYSAPDCGSNRAAFETCCNGSIATFDLSSSQSAGANTIATAEDLLFLTCSIDSETSNWDPLST